MNKSTGSHKDLQCIWFREVVCVKKKEKEKKRRRGKTCATCSKLVNLDKCYMKILFITLETCLKFVGKDSKGLSKPQIDYMIPFLLMHLLGYKIASDSSNICLFLTVPDLAVSQQNSQ